MPLKRNQEDNRPPPGFAVVVVHHRPHQLIAMLVCQSVRAKLYRYQLLAHAYQQPVSDVQVHHQQPACLNPEAQSLHKHRQSNSDCVTIKKAIKTLIRLSSKW